MAAAQGLDLQVKIQRINPLGGLPWGANGKDFSTLSNQYERNLTMGIAPDDDYLYVAAEVTPTSQGQMGTMAQKIHLRTGALAWGAAARTVFAISNRDQSPQGDIGFIASKPVFLYTDGFNNGGTPVRLLAAFLDTAGTLLDTVQMGTYSAPKGRIHLSGAHGFDVTAVWNEDRGNGSLPFAHRINRTPCPAVSAGASWGSVLDSAWLTYTGAGADSLYWTLGDGTTASSAPTDTLRHTYAANGTYTVWQFAHRSCGSVDSSSTQVLIQGIGLDEALAVGFRVAPNPAHDNLQHFAPQSVSEARLVNLHGQCLAVVRDWHPRQTWTLPENLAAGLYFIMCDYGAISVVIAP
jgi:hypothetical protein